MFSDFEKTKYLYHSQFIFRSPSVFLQDVVENLFCESQQKIFKESIYLASPILYDELIKWHQGELKEKKEVEKLIVSLYKYYTRMGSRCTPYGLFAGCSVGKWANKSDIVISDDVCRSTRLDMNYLCSLAQYLSSHPTILPLLKFYPNNSIYSIGDQLRYVEYSYSNNRRLHQISAAQHSDYLKRILDKAKSGYLIKDLANEIVDDEITVEDAEAFVKELIDNQIIVSELEPSVTGEEFLYQLIKTLKKINSDTKIVEIESIIQLLENIQQDVAEIDTHIGNDVSSYRAVYQKLKAFDMPIQENNLFQTDFYKKCNSATLDAGIQQQLLDTVNFLNNFFIKEENQNLKKFRENFYSEYEEAERPLLEVLDTETGIGYTGKDTSGVNVLLDDIRIPVKVQYSQKLNWTHQQKFIHERLLTAIKENIYTVNFTDLDLSNTNAGSLPDTMAIMFRMIGDKKLFFQGGGGSSAANLLGRFAHGDTQIHEIIKDITSHEQKLNNDKILAEIVHLPESRTGNILLRPVLRDYEIPYLGKSSAPPEKQIQLDDIMVSVKGDRIVLRSKRLNKEIAPRLSTAHNYSFNALPVYQFLCDIQTQNFDKSGLGFNWGVLSGSYKFLPRAEYKGVILKPAQWQFSKADFQILLDCKEVDYSIQIATWRQFWNIPVRVVLVEGDNELHINFEDELGVKLFFSIIKKRDSIILDEFLFDINDLLVKDSRGNGYTNECIAILLKNIDEKKVASQSVPFLKKEKQNYVSLQRNFSIGSEWLYYKFYCGVKTSDRILLEVIKPFTEEVINKQWADEFFFIRYSDPDLHIRLRFHLNNTENIGKIIILLHQYIHPYLEQGLINKIQTDTYKRELERYGINSMELIESFFYIDSVVTLNFLNLITNDTNEQVRWQFALHSVDDLLTNFQYTPNDKLALLKHLKESFLNEHGNSKELRFQLSAKYRKLRNDLENGMKHKESSTEEMFLLLKWKEAQLQSVTNQIMELKNTNQLEVPLNDIISSCTHMMLNRIFKARQRTYEMLIYDLLYRYYESLIARDKKGLN
ncbi:MAG: lantibiotic dehydratase [Bacteroidia bacterium]